MTSNEDIIKLILNPPNAPIPAQDLWTISLNMAIIIDEIWKARNHILFQEGKADLAKAKLNVAARFSELSKVYSPITNHSPDPLSTSWFPPPPECIKINVDAALNSSKSALAVVARNHHGDVLFVWGKQHHLCNPSQAEASALLWVVQLAIQKHWNAVIFEGDAKICFDALTLSNQTPSWQLSTLISNIRRLSSNFLSCSFRWVRRSANSAAHEVAKFALISIFPFCFSEGNLPPSLEVVCKGDASVFRPS
ncbi:hypothetical protein SO802_018036 [Lithocarpus litseifolius]|uniref:RNase H type-1 domain-containing protein n=1 Tax=Lithocarpus litseifolius TaxID=425828 RepID=A0AAW2CLQ5_9ROSI